MGQRNRVGKGLLLSLVASAALLGGFASTAAASPGALRILIAEEQCDSTQATTLQSEILAQPGVAAVDFFDAGSATPTAAQLDPYDVVFFMGNCGPADETAIGNNLADYEDQGGVVVAATFDWQGTSYVAGRWVTDGYSPYQTNAGSDFGSNTLGTHDSTSPLLAGVSSLNGFYVDAVSLTSGATEIAQWSGGDSAVAVKGQAVGINAYLGDYYTPVSTYWSGDFAKIIVNAGNVLGPHTLSITKQGDGTGTVTSTPAGIDCGATCAFGYANGTAVTLTATPSAGSTFAGWSGVGCSGTGSCAVTMSSDQGVTATFTTSAPGCPDLAGAYNQGFNAGFNSGFNAGFRAGYKRGFNAGFGSRAHAISAAVLPPACDQAFNQGFGTGFRGRFHGGFQKGFSSGFNRGYSRRHHR